MRKIPSILAAAMIAISMVTATGVSASAETLDTPVEEIDIEEFAYATYATNGLSISGNTATCTSDITANPGVTRIVVTNYLERNVSGSWVVVASWKASTMSSNELSTNDTYTGLSSGTYRLRTEFEVYVGISRELITVYS